MENLELITKKIRRLMIETCVPTVTHHIGSGLSMVEILVALYWGILKVDPNNPRCSERDRVILSKGHGALALYCVLCEKGFFNLELLDQFDKDDSIMIEHANNKIPGVELSTGSLGHGLPVGNGMALAFKKDDQENRVYVVMSDGEMDEGSNWEGFLFGSHHKLNNLTAVVDFNHFQGYGESQQVMQTQPLKEKLEAFGWQVFEVDGHNFEQLVKVLNFCKKIMDKPQVVIAYTTKGKGVSMMEGKFESHYMSLSEEEKEKILMEL